MTEESGRIVTFYSYKGGTGRTMALANVAWILASRGNRVLAVDWDLESPGLHRYFHPFLVDKHLSSTPGVIDLVRGFARATMDPSPVEDLEWYRAHAKVLDFAVSLQWKFDKPGVLDLLSPGKQDSSYSTAVSTFDWGKFYERQGGGVFLDALGEDMRRQYDYVLIDSRTGLSDTAGICTAQLPDMIVNCFTLSTQSVDGAVSVAHSMRSLRRGRPLRILPVPMRVEDAEKTKLEAGRDYARVRFDPFLAHLDLEGRDRYWGDVEIPYKPFYAYEEILASFGERPRQENTLLSAFERLTRAVTDGEVDELRAVEEPERRRWLTEFERPKPAVPSDVFVSYAPEDRMWAEWVSAELGRAGFRVRLHGAGRQAGGDLTAEIDRALAATTRTVMLLSAEYVRSPQALRVWESVSARDPGGSQRQLLPIRIADVRLEPPFTDRVAVDLVGLTAERALDELLLAAGEPSRAIGVRDAGDDGPRYPGSAPPVWNVASRNTAFTGRGLMLEKMRDQLATGRSVVLPQALFGLGGVGKTQIALEYAHRFAANYDVVWWIPAEQPSRIWSALAALAPHLDIPTADSLNETALAVLDALRRGEPYRRWLLVFDNAEDPDDLARFIPQGAGHVLVTSRNQDWAKLYDHIEVDVFSREESIQLLTRRCPMLRPADAARVAEELGDLPLAIEQAGAWLETTGMPVDTYLGLLRTEITRLLAESAPAGYPASAAATWLVSIERLRAQTPAAARLLELCAFFAPEPIPMSLLYGDRVLTLLTPYDPSLRDPILLGRLVREIGRYALARIDQGQNSIQVHRLVQAVVRDLLSVRDQQTTRHEVHTILADANPRDTDDPKNWDRYAELWPHLTPSKALGCPSDAVRHLIVEEVRYLWKLSDYSSSQDLAERVLARWQQVLDENDEPTFDQDDSWTLYLRFQLANALRSQARYKEAHELDVDVLDRMRATLGESHPYTLMTSGSLAADLRALGAYADAKDVDETTLARFRDVYGDDHPRTLMVANNLAVSLLFVGDPFGARDLDQDTLERRKRVLGANHPYTLFSANNLARDLRETGAFAAAASMQEDTVARYVQVLGENHPETLRAVRNLAVGLRKLGRFADARALSAETLGRYRRQHGPDHPDTLGCATNLACDLLALGEAQRARELSEDTLRRYQRVLGDSHPFTLACTNNLVIVLLTLGEPVQAEAMVEPTAAGLRGLLGPDHPYTLACATNHGHTLNEIGQHEEAVRLDRDTYRRYQLTLRDSHPDTLASGSNLSIGLRTLGFEDEAAELRETVLQRCRETLGDAHPNTAFVLARRPLNCDIAPPPT